METQHSVCVYCIYLCKIGLFRIINKKNSHLNGKKYPNLPESTLYIWREPQISHFWHFELLKLILSHLCEFGASAVGELTAQIDRSIWTRSDLIFYPNTLTPDRCKRGKSETLELSSIVAYIKMLKMKPRHQANMKHTKVTVIFQGLSFLREKVQS